MIYLRLPENSSVSASVASGKCQHVFILETCASITTRARATMPTNEIYCCICSNQAKKFVNNKKVTMHGSTLDGRDISCLLMFAVFFGILVYTKGTSKNIKEYMERM